MLGALPGGEVQEVSNLLHVNLDGAQQNIKTENIYAQAKNRVAVQL